MVPAGRALPAVCGGGLAALPVFLPVADPRVPQQAVTAALMPVTGLPVLTAAARPHSHPHLRDTAFVRAVLAGGYARRWGARGNVLRVAACVFGVFCSAPVSCSRTAIFVMLMAGTLYGLLGVLTPALLVLRLEESGVGALGAVLAVLLVLSVTPPTRGSGARCTPYGS